MSSTELPAVCVDCPWSTGELPGDHMGGGAAHLHIQQTGHTVSVLSTIVIDDVPSAGRLVVDQRTGPRTIIGPGEYCLLCDDPMDSGAVYLFVRDVYVGSGVVHESCLDVMDSQVPGAGLWSVDDGLG